MREHSPTLSCLLSFWMPPKKLRFFEDPRKKPQSSRWGWEQHFWDWGSDFEDNWGLRYWGFLRINLKNLKFWGEDEVKDFEVFGLPSTIYFLFFFQQYFVCDYAINVECNNAESFYNLNANFGQVTSNEDDSSIVEEAWFTITLKMPYFVESNE